jgi:hypothetical protein
MVTPSSFMTPMTLELQHNEAMRKEVGYRLRVLLSREPASAPERLVQLVRELSKADRDLLGEDVLGPAGSVERTQAWVCGVFVQQEQYLRERLQDEPSGDGRDELERLLAKIEDTLRSEFGARRT